MTAVLVAGLLFFELVLWSVFSARRHLHLLSPPVITARLPCQWDSATAAARARDIKYHSLSLSLRSGGAAVVLTKTCLPRARNRLVTFAVIDTKESPALLRHRETDRTERQLENRANRETAKIALSSAPSLFSCHSHLLLLGKMVVAAIITPPPTLSLSNCQRGHGQRMNWEEARPLKLWGISRLEISGLFTAAGGVRKFRLRLRE